MAHIVYCLQDDDNSNNDVVSMIDYTKKIDNDHNNIVSMIDHAEAALNVDDTKENNDDNLDNAVLMIDCMKKTNDDHNNIVSMVDRTEVLLLFLCFLNLFLSKMKVATSRVET